jgi:hypothetical protein
MSSQLHKLIVSEIEKECLGRGLKKQAHLFKWEVTPDVIGTIAFVLN